jgi:hypothetical protein
VQLERIFRLSRRRLLALCGGIAAARVGGQTNLAKPARLRLEVVKVFKNGFLLATSPDGSRICLRSSAEPIGRFKLQVASEGQTMEHKGAQRFNLKVFETGTWNEVYSSTLTGQLGELSFFADGGALYGETTEVTQPLTTHRVVVSLGGRKVEEIEEPYNPECGAHYRPVSDRVLIGASRSAGLVKVTWPDFSTAASSDEKS